MLSVLLSGEQGRDGKVSQCIPGGPGGQLYLDRSLRYPTGCGLSLLSTRAHPRRKAGGHTYSLNPAGVSSWVLCHGPVHGLVPWPRLVPLEGHPGVQQHPEPCGDLQGASGWAVQGLCQDLPFPAAAGMEKAGLLCPATSQADSRQEHVLGSPRLVAGSPLGFRTTAGEGKADTCRDTMVPAFPSGRRDLGFSSLSSRGSFPERGLFRGLEAGWKGEAPAQAVPQSSLPPWDSLRPPFLRLQIRINSFVLRVHPCPPFPEALCMECFS